MIEIVKYNDKLSFEDNVAFMNDRILYNTKSIDGFCVLETNSKDYYQQLPCVESIYDERQGDLQSVKFIPGITPNKLRKHSFVGWGGINVAVVDSGANDITISHKFNLVDGTENVQDFINHGTIVSKIIKYFASACNISIFKITDNMKVQEMRAIQALDLIAMNAGMFDLVNLSFGFEKKCINSSCVLCKLTEKIVSMGVTVVAAAGNGGPKVDTIHCPGRSKLALTVGALAADGSHVAMFSSRGTTQSGKPDLVAPSHIIINLPNKIEPIEKEGTSFSTPVISGICASFYGEAQKNGKDVKDIIMKSLVKLEKIPDCEQGFGVINMERLTEVLKSEFNHPSIKQSSH